MIAAQTNISITAMTVSRLNKTLVTSNTHIASRDTQVEQLIMHMAVAINICAAENYFILREIII